MSFDHKAYELDYVAFTSELEPILIDSLMSNRECLLRHFIQYHLDALKDPYEGEPLSEEWEVAFENRDIHEYGDYALTKFYAPDRNIGLANSWTDILPLLQEEDPELLVRLLGQTIEVNGVCFDPGRMGSYFQTPAAVQSNLASVLRLMDSHPTHKNGLKSLLDMLSQVSPKKGLYVTF